MSLQDHAIALRDFQGINDPESPQLAIATDNKLIYCAARSRPTLFSHLGPIAIHLKY